MKKLPNGYLLADRATKPPCIPAGYEVSFDDPYLFLPILPVCFHRERKTIVLGCCGATQKIFCKREKKTVTRKECLDCDVTIVAIGG